ncbi:MULTISPECIES: ATP-dependent sacrificial sulfur transferase LarE [unclassified Streptomyces]|uniref:ATP-dependent sacrificial sulfur transferase LarE n=1 Tax=unclassified Streptomyces TaxID=2593676 RepID=UPI002DD9E21B|nr:ATP-dependent sacrificial sulfur transferase LarE [Streptomyces sp. NBC_00243]WRZ17349.1 ATP-dependent sacrificial sulfur transferase LarE [Streptomyces sp. NBC_00243]
MVQNSVAVEAARLLLVEVSAYGRTLVAFSGGVDSSVVVAAAAQAIGTDRMAAVTAVSPSLPAAELDLARQFCAGLGVVHHLVDTHEIDVPGYRDNGSNRCYFCKSTLLDTALQLAAEEGFETIATGTNSTDLAAGFRPGIGAAAERSARTPLADTGLDKEAVRAVARLWSLPTWDKPAMACLSSRVAYGIQITESRLARIERAEAAVRVLLAGRGRGNVRVRDLGDSVRLEVDREILAEARNDARLAEEIRLAGFGTTPVSMEAFRSGSMNELLS